MLPVDTNPNSDSKDFSPNILPDKSGKTDFWSHLTLSIAERSAKGLSRQVVVSRPVGPTTIERNGHLAINFGANDYLGLAWHPELIRAAYSNSGSPNKVGSGASPLVTGHSQIHAELVSSIATFEATESAIVFSSGYAANLGSLAALATKEDVIFSDSLNHACLIDGCRLSRARVLVYPHCDTVALRRLIQEHRHLGRFAFVVTDSVFSMDGDLAPLSEIDGLCGEFDMQCVIDEAHATGVYGRFGRGLTEHLNVLSERMIRIGTLSKAVGCVGGFVAGKPLLIDWLTNHARSWIYSTAMTIPNTLAAIRALSLVRGMQEERKLLERNATSIRLKLNQLGFRVGAGSSPIIPVYFHDAREVIEKCQRLLEQGIYVPAIRPPTVPAGTSLLRISLSAVHSESELSQLVSAFQKM